MISSELKSAFSSILCISVFEVKNQYNTVCYPVFLLTVIWWRNNKGKSWSWQVRTTLHRTAGLYTCGWGLTQCSGPPNTTSSVVRILGFFRHVTNYSWSSHKTKYNLPLAYKIGLFLESSAHKKAVQRELRVSICKRKLDSGFKSFLKSFSPAWISGEGFESFTI